jgi:hypothetical protein
VRQYLEGNIEKLKRKSRKKAVRRKKGEACAKNGSGQYAQQSGRSLKNVRSF